MFIVLLTFGPNKANAQQFMPGHNAWIKQGFDDDVFLMAGSIEVGKGGSLLAYNTTLDDLQQRVAQDPFVAEQVVNAEIIEVSAKKTDPRLAFLTE